MNSKRSQLFALLLLAGPTAANADVTAKSTDKSMLDVSSRIALARQNLQARVDQSGVQVNPKFKTAQQPTPWSNG